MSNIREDDNVDRMQKEVMPKYHIMSIIMCWGYSEKE